MYVYICYIRFSDCTRHWRIKYVKFWKGVYGLGFRHFTAKKKLRKWRLYTTVENHIPLEFRNGINTLKYDVDLTLLNLMFMLCVRVFIFLYLFVFVCVIFSYFFIFAVAVSRLSSYRSNAKLSKLEVCMRINYWYRSTNTDTFSGTKVQVLTPGIHSCIHMYKSRKHVFKHAVIWFPPHDCWVVLIWPYQISDCSILVYSWYIV